jgi:hypothetical protein
MLEILYKKLKLMYVDNVNPWLGSNLELGPHIS